MTIGIQYIHTADKTGFPVCFLSTYTVSTLATRTVHVVTNFGLLCEPSWTRADDDIYLTWKAWIGLYCTVYCDLRTLTDSSYRDLETRIG